VWCAQEPEPSIAQKIVAFKEAFWKFLRPHTIRGTILGSSAVTAIALLENTAVGGGVGCRGDAALQIMARRLMCRLLPPIATQSLLPGNGLPCFWRAAPSTRSPLPPVSPA
jgi:hypothetical protein